MEKLEPVFQYIRYLDPFEKISFSFAVFVVYLLSGFVTDSLIRPAGFGPYGNGVVAMAGVVIGIYVKYNYFIGFAFLPYEPYLTCGLLLAPGALLLLFLNLLRDRLP
jgi:hypothetical protein